MAQIVCNNILYDCVIQYDVMVNMMLWWMRLCGNYDVMVLFATSTLSACPLVVLYNMSVAGVRVVEFDTNVTVCTYRNWKWRWCHHEGGRTAGRTPTRWQISGHALAPAGRRMAERRRACGRRLEERRLVEDRHVSVRSGTQSNPRVATRTHVSGCQTWGRRYLESARKLCLERRVSARPSRMPGCRKQGV